MLCENYEPEFWKKTMLKICLMFLGLASFQECVADSQDLSYPQPDIEATYGGGTIQIDSEIDHPDHLKAGIPIQGYVTIIHKTEKIIDPGSFRLGDKPLQVQFVSRRAVTSDGKILRTVYQFQLEGRKSGIHTLPSIRVNISGKEYLAIPLKIEIKE